MLNRILPDRIDNRYRGHPVGLWLFVPIALIKISQSLEQLLLASIFLLVLIRYRALIALMYFLMVAHYIGARIVGQFKPLALAGTSGVSTPFLVIAILSVAGLILSLIGRGYADQVARP